MMAKLYDTAGIALEYEHHTPADLSCWKCHFTDSNEKRRFLPTPRPWGMPGLGARVWSISKLAL